MVHTYAAGVSFVRLYCLLLVYVQVRVEFCCRHTSRRLPYFANPYKNLRQHLLKQGLRYLVACLPPKLCTGFTDLSSIPEVTTNVVVVILAHDEV